MRLCILTTLYCSIRRGMNPNRDKERRTENNLCVWILEAKGISAKRRYYCELCINKTLYARTAAKAKADICFWGEFYEFKSVNSRRLDLKPTLHFQLPTSSRRNMHQSL